MLSLRSSVLQASTQVKNPCVQAKVFSIPVEGINHFIHCESYRFSSTTTDQNVTGVKLEPEKSVKNEFVGFTYDDAMLTVVGSVLFM